MLSSDTVYGVFTKVTKVNNFFNKTETNKNFKQTRKAATKRKTRITKIYSEEIKKQMYISENKKRGSQQKRKITIYKIK